MAARWRAPGRINLIGEHTDYNDGFVLPFAIDFGCVADVRARPDDELTITSAQLGGPVTVSPTQLGRGRAALDERGCAWAAYPAGVVWALRERGHAVPGLSITLDSSVPVGSGLSSSAALVCSLAVAVDDLCGLRLSADELLTVTRSAENDFAGAPTGGMDQLAALRAQPGQALFCDMRTLAVEPVPLELDAADRVVLVIDSRAPHRHADGEYRRRREGCERAARVLGVPALRDIDPAALDAALQRLPGDELRRYTRHVVTENERVLRTVGLLRAGHLDAIGPLLTESHASMREDYRITVAEVDLAVQALLDAGALGARMTGGGFGGCVIALLGTDTAAGAAAAVERAYAAAGHRPPRCFTVARPSGGAHRIEEPA